MTDIMDKLRAPFRPEQISWRVGSTTADKSKGMALAYIDSRDVQDRLDEVCGPENWQSSYPHAGAKTVCRIEIRVGDEWVGKEDGAGDSDVEKEKGALSDAFKRAAVRWGIGRYLYDMDSPWVKLKPIGKSFAIADEEHARLQALLGKKAPAPPKPQPKGALKLVHPEGEVGAETIGQWLGLYEEAADQFGKSATYELNKDLLAKIQAKAVKDGHQEIVTRIKNIYEEGKAA
jgi:hypothetical protein